MCVHLGLISNQFGLVFFGNEAMYEAIVTNNTERDGQHGKDEVHQTLD